ncbi:hypothetical protein CMT77_07905 [Elizabethkingia anophelis]|nr:hypothetical protein [Elizabethkingia anophelis]
MKKLEELFAEMTREIPFVVNEELKPYILELSQVYAREVAQASLEKAADKLVHFIDTYNADHSEIKLEITDEQNIVML